jgi:hypothetical protein
MNIFEKFLNSISYKFPKGYPDLNNEQDILIIESELRQLGVEAKIPKKSVENPNPEINNILQTLQKAGTRTDVLPQVEAILTNYSPEQLKTFTDNFRKYTVNDLDKIYDTFASDFFNVKAKEGEGRGEVMLLIGLKDSKAGGLKTKDITIDGKVYEVKELTGNEFRTGSDGNISGTSYLKNLIDFKTLFNKDIADSLDLTEEEKTIINNTINYYTKYEPNNGSAGFLKDLTLTCKILKNKIPTQKENPVKYISANGKKIAISNDDYNKLVPQAGDVNIDLGDELQDTKIKINKLKRHPWIEDPNLVIGELRQKLDSFIESVDYFIFFNYPGSPKGKLLSSEETAKQFTVGRIVFASVNAKLVKQ